MREKIQKFGTAFNGSFQKYKNLDLYIKKALGENT